MDSIDSGKAGFTYQQPVHTMLSHPVVADSKAERIESSLESSSKTKEYSLDEWEQQRGHITNLYVAQEKTLPQVADLMEYKYGFIASQRQYKRRFAKWGLDTKNIRDHDMRLALAKDLKRKREGKDTEFEINGRLLPRQKMQRFMVRKELSEEDVIRSDAPTPPYVTYHTPHPDEHENVTDTLASISLGKDVVMTDACATHDEGTENLIDHTKTSPPDKQYAERASTFMSTLPSSDKVRDDSSKILKRNEAWLSKRVKARNDPKLLLAYARLILSWRKQDPRTFQIHFLHWRSYFIRRLGYYDGYWGISGSKVPSFLLDFINCDVKALAAHWILDADYPPFDSLNFTELSPLITTGVPSVPHVATNQGSDYAELLRKDQSSSSVSRPEPVLSSLREEGFSELQSIPTASPFERWSQRYDISSSPNWIRSYMSPSNPLSLLTPAPIGTPWGHIAKPSPRLTASPGYGSRVFNKNNTDVHGDNFHSLPVHANIEDFTLVEAFTDSGLMYQKFVLNRVVQTPAV